MNAMPAWGLTEGEFTVLRQAGLSADLTDQIDVYAQRVRWPHLRRLMSSQAALSRFALLMIGVYMVGVWAMGLNVLIMGLIAWSPLIAFAIWRVVLVLFGRQSAWKRSILGHAIAASRHTNLKKSWDFRHLQAMADAIQHRDGAQSEADAIRGYLFRAFRGAWIVLPTVVICLGPGVIVGLVSIAG